MRDAAADIEILTGLQEHGTAGHLRQLGPKPVIEAVGAGPALIARFQPDYHEAGIEGACPPIEVAQPETYYQLGLAYLAQGNKEKAMWAYAGLKTRDRGYAEMLKRLSK